MVSGSTRAASTNTALCRTAAVAAPAGVDVETYLDVSVLPHFDPDDDREPLPPAVQQLTDKPVAWVKAAADPRRGEGAHATLATVLGYVQARVVEDACRHVPVARESVGPDGLVADPAVHAGIADAITTLLTAAGR